MEHRWGERRPIGIEVRLICRGKPIGRGCLRDASVSGAFIVTELALPMFASVHVQLGLAARGTLARARMVAAHIVRLDEAGVGIEWGTLAPVGLDGLLRLASVRDRAPRQAERHPAVHA